MSNPYQEQDYNTDTLDTKLWSKILAYFWVYKKDIALIAVSMVTLAMVDVAFPFLNKVAIDTFILGGGDLSGLTPFIGVYVTLILTQSFVVFFFVRQTGKVEMQFAYDIRKQAFEKLQLLSFSYYDKTPSGWILARMTTDITRLTEIVSWSIIDLIWGGTLIVGVSVVMLWVNWRLALLVLMIVPILAVISIYFQRRILKEHRLTRRINSQITAAFSEGILGAKTSKTLVLEEQLGQDFNQLTGKMRQASIRAALLNALFMPIVMSLGALSTSLLLWRGGQAVLVGSLAFGTLVLFTQYVTQFFEPLRQLARILAEFQMAQASAERVLTLLNAEVSLVDSEAVMAKYGTILEPIETNYEPIEGRIKFDHVNFYYNEKEPVLQDFNLEVKAGEMIAFVGETGSGKSTLVNLLCRFYEPTGGRILIDGIDLQSRSIAWLHSHLGYVLQSPHLFSGTIKDNIRYGRLDASDEEIVQAAKQVSAHEFIMQMESGYDSEVGEGGSRLSTGQKQLISFARAILAQPSIFVLDEASSSIDTETEAIIQSTIESVLKGKTTFIIAHRLSTIVNADRICLIDHGKIVEMGSHKELMAKRGAYYKLYTNQFTEAQQFALLNRQESTHAS
jgi:ATP-binding cassette, subfamily B, bacterial